MMMMMERMRVRRGIHEGPSGAIEEEGRCRSWRVRRVMRQKRRGGSRICDDDCEWVGGSVA